MNIIRILRVNKGWTQAQLAQECGVHQTAVSQWECGRTQPDRDALAALSLAFGVTVDALLGSEPAHIRVPILGYVRAGAPLEAIENNLGYEEISAEMASHGEHFALTIRGESMLPRFCPGDTVIVRRQSEVGSGDIAVALIDGQDTTVKKVIKKGTSIMLVPLNPDYEPLVFSPDSSGALPLSFLGKVVELRARFT